MFQNADDYRPICERCGEPMTVGTTRLHNQYCDDCDEVYCLVHECSATGGPDQKAPAKKEKKGYLLKISRCTLEATSAAGKVYRESWDTVVVPQAGERLVIDQILQALRAKGVSEVKISVSKSL